MVTGGPPGLQQFETRNDLGPSFDIPRFLIPFVLETDASSSAIGVVLMQKGRPIAFFSKQFTQKLQRASTYVRKLHAMTTTIRKWRQYLLGHKFIILTDYQS